MEKENKILVGSMLGVAVCLTEIIVYANFSKPEIMYSDNNIRRDEAVCGVD